MIFNTMCKSFQIVIEFKMNRMDDIREIIHGNHEEIESICNQWIS